MGQRTNPSGTGASSSKLLWADEPALLTGAARTFGTDEVRVWLLELGTVLGTTVERAEIVEEPLLAELAGLAFRLYIVSLSRKEGKLKINSMGK